MKFSSMIVGLAALSSNVSFATQTVTPKWSLEETQRQCDMYDNNSQSLSFKVDIICEKVARRWVAKKASSTLCSYDSVTAKVFPKKAHREIEMEPGSELLSESYGPNEQSLVCHNYSEEVAQYKKTIQVSCDAVRKWKTVSDAVSACNSIEVVDGMDPVTWAPTGLEWATMTDSQKDMYPELEPRMINMCGDLCDDSSQK